MTAACRAPYISVPNPVEPDAVLRACTEQLLTIAANVLTRLKLKQSPAFFDLEKIKALITRLDVGYLKANFAFQILLSSISNC